MGKKLILWLLRLCGLILLPACGRLAGQIVLPDPEKITFAEVTQGDSVATYTSREWIAQVVSGLGKGTPTRKESVQDTPQAETYCRVDFHQAAGASTQFVYEEGGRCYAEQPYQGIWEIGRETLQRIAQPIE